MGKVYCQNCQSVVNTDTYDCPYCGYSPARQGKICKECVHFDEDSGCDFGRPYEEYAYACPCFDDDIWSDGR